MASVVRLFLSVAESPIVEPSLHRAATAPVSEEQEVSCVVSVVVVVDDWSIRFLAS